MRVVVVRQCDVIMPGTGHPAARKRALFPGISYEVPEELASELIASGHLAVGGEPTAPPSPAVEVRAAQTGKGGRNARGVRSAVDMAADGRADGDGGVREHLE